MVDFKAKLTTEWLQKAHHDLRSARRLMQPAPILDTAVYHCQQAAEKALKGYLTSHDVTVQKTHDLTVLLTQCVDFDTRFTVLYDACDILTPYGTAFRYPGSEFLPEIEDAEAALVLANDIVDFVENVLGKLSLWQ
jgi:HEPN domain-containing protein